MTGDPSLRHIEALVNQVLTTDEMSNVLRKGLEAVLSAIMEAEVTQQTGASYGERSEGRKAHRNGYRERTFSTGLGTSKLKIPKLRQGSYFPSFLHSKQRSDDALVLALVRCFRDGVSTRKVENIGRALGVEGMRKSTVSAMVKRLDPQVKAFRERELPACPYVFLDARYENVRENHSVRKVAVLVAIGVRYDGHREVLGFGVERVENETYWREFIGDLVERGLTGVKLVVSDAHEGLRRAISKGLPGAQWQRCKVHFLRNLGTRLPKRQRPSYLALAKTIFAQESWEDAVKQRSEVAEVLRRAGKDDAAEFLEQTDEVLTFMRFPPDHWTKIHSTNLVERLNRELKRRTRVVSIFPNRQSLTRLVGALLLEEHEEWLVSRRYISERSIRQLLTPAEQLEADVPGSSRLLSAAK